MSSRAWPGTVLGSAVTGLVLAAPAACLGVLAFMQGGFFPGSTGVAAAAGLAFVALAAWRGVVPWASLSRPLLAAIGLFALFAVWTLLSAGWSHAPGRALLEYQRVLLYLAALTGFGLLGASDRRARVLVVLLGLVALGVAIAALAAWLMPDRFPVSEIYERRRMSWPTSYWNTTGLIGSFGAVWGLHLASDRRTSILLRLVGAAAVPLQLALVAYTASRGAAIAALAGLVAYVLLARTWSMLLSLLVLVPAGVLALHVADATVALDSLRPPPEGIASGRAAAMSLAWCAAGSAVARAVLMAAEAPLSRIPKPRLTRPLRLGAVALGCVVVLSALVVVDAPRRLSDAYEQFRSDSPIPSGTATARLTNISNDGRIDHWRVAIDDGFDREPLHGTGAGTFVELWQAHRPTTFNVLDAHSLYIEQLGELGLVGTALLLATLVLCLGALIRRSTSVGGGPWAALAAASVAWLVLALVDWNWEMPALTAWLFAAGGLALGGRHRAGEGWSMRPPAWIARVAAVAVCGALAVLPVKLAASQRHIDASVAALQGGDCRTSAAEASAARLDVDQRSEPYELLAYCAVRLGAPDAARTAVLAAVRRDPGDWELRYAEALVDGATGHDPRSAARAAYVRDPLSQYAYDLHRTLSTAPRRRWRRIALRAPLPVPLRYCGGPIRHGQPNCAGPILRDLRGGVRGPGSR